MTNVIPFPGTTPVAAEVNMRDMNAGELLDFAHMITSHTLDALTLTAGRSTLEYLRAAEANLAFAAVAYYVEQDLQR